MTDRIHLPCEQISRSQLDVDLLADYLELKAIMSEDKSSLKKDIIIALEHGFNENLNNGFSETEERERIASEAITRIKSRVTILKTAYPFTLEKKGQNICLNYDRLNFAHTAYLISLLLSNLRSVSELLVKITNYPSPDDVYFLRKCFQYIATVAIAGEIGGRAWSFGFPRPDHSNFFDKLTEIWKIIKDGEIEVDPSAPEFPKDDGIDVFACQEPADGLPGFLLVAAQVATGESWKYKSILAHANRRFTDRWFGRQPATKMIVYHVIPFARPDYIFRDDVLTVGNLLHRTRIPSRILKAEALVKNGIDIEGFNKLEEASDWVKRYFDI